MGPALHQGRRDLRNFLAKLDAGVLTLKFNTVYDGASYKNAIEAGKPYIVKWTTTGDAISNPVFSGVTISNAAAAEVESNDKNVKFVGQYSPFAIDDSNKEAILYIGSGNKIGYSSKARTLKSCRAHFWVKPNDNGTPAARMISIDFGEGEVTGITTTDLTDSTDKAGTCYDLQGRKVTKPQKGLYIVNGKKVVIK